ncbi:tetratricopeptide repeat protein [Fulvivirga sp. M361]|uniref:YfgM family protein n=1 Tax=Fulvivirga sp. M361 TaxID=2594266 RepID=UPI001179EFA6|nr:tetratricopeptide repeat protein [Fulvivirga sp. M361]TRX55595.1 tetratricopeptide repeat protein [Fulvivirga sp. M361]
MAVKSKKKEEEKHGTDFLENPDALADQLSQTEEFIENNKALVYGVAIVTILVLGGIFGFRYYKNSQNELAQSEMFQAVYYFEADSLGLALDGDGNNLGFVDIVEDYGMTDAGNLANFYAGTAYLKQGKFKLAILYLEDFSSDDLLVQARAYSLIGDAHMELKDYANAATFYTKAANHKTNKFFTPQYLMKAGIAYEKASKNTEAIDAYQIIIDTYHESAEFQNAKKFKARLVKEA